MEILTIEKCFTSEPWPKDGNRTVTLHTKERGEVKYTVYQGKDNPFSNYQEVNGRAIRCDVTPKGYIAKGNFEFVDGAAPQQSNGTAPQQNAQIRTSSDPRQNSIERQACMKTAAELFDSCVSNGVVNGHGLTNDQITNWVSEVARMLHSKCLG